MCKLKIPSCLIYSCDVVLEISGDNCLYFSAFDMEREREWRQRENALKVQIAQLEATLKADLGEKGKSQQAVRQFSIVMIMAMITHQILLLLR